MEHLRWFERPHLTDPVLVLAFEGWSDAGRAATTATTWIEDHWGGDIFATIDPDEFYDFTEARPQATIVDGERTIDWPVVSFCSATTPGGRDLIVVQGPEPHNRWRAFTEAVLEVVREHDVATVITLGGVFADVPHTRPVRVFGSSNDPLLSARLGLAPSTYEGPTGIVGVLTVALRDAGLDTVSLWASVPGYVAAMPSPKGTMALLIRLGDVLLEAVDTLELADASAAYERRINEMVARDDENQAYVAALEARHDEAIAAAAGDGALAELAGSMLDEHTDLIAEVERFLRENEG